MMDINRNNYELFFMDYLDGRMSPDQVIRLMSFLKENPDLKTELKEFKDINIEPGKTKFEPKRTLKKQFIINDLNFDNFCIAGLEGDLTNEESKLFQTWLQQNPLKAREFELYKKARLIPEKITFDLKSTLKKSSGSRIIAPKVWGYVSAAASIIILITLYIIISQPTGTTTAETKSQTVPETQAKIEIEKENTPYNTPIDSTKQENTTRINDIVEKPVIAQEVNIVPEKSNSLIKPDAIVITLKKIRRKNINPIPEKPILAALVPTKELEVIENPYTNLTLSQKAVKSFKSEILKEEKEKINPDKLTIWDIADAGIKGVNKIIGWKMEFDKKYDEEGELTALAFDSNTISFNHNMNK